MPAPVRRAPADLQRFLSAQVAAAWCFAEWCLPGGAVAELLQAATRQFVDSRSGGRQEGWPLEFWRALLRCLPGAVDGAAEAPIDWDEPAARLDWDEALRQLPDEQRRIFLLRIWIGFDVAQCATLMDSSEGIAKTRLYRALQHLRATLPDAEAGPGEGWVLRCRERLQLRAAARAAEVRPQLQRIVDEACAGAVPAARRGRRHALLGALLGAAVLLLWWSSPGDPPTPLRPPSTASAPAAHPPAGVPALPVEQLLSLPAEDFALIAGPAEFELLAELEFYRWQLQRGDDDAPR